MEQTKYRRYKNGLEKFLDSNKGKRFFNIVYSVGAAIVILGAMFKLLHLPAGDLMLMIGMITEAIVFLLSAFEKPDKEYKWEEVYPVLADNPNFVPKTEREHNKIAGTQKQSTNSANRNNRNGNDNGNRNQQNGGSNGNNFVQGNNNTPSTNNSPSSQINTQQPNQSNVVYSNTSTSENTASNNDTTNTYGASTIVSGTIFSDGGNVTEASEKYADQLTRISENMEKFAKVTNSLGTISDSLLQSFQTIIENSAGIGNNTNGYITQMEALNRNIAGLNTIYEIQLKGVSGQINTIEEINAGLDRMKKLYSGSLADSSLFKNETEKMAKQLAELNVVYARLLQAMTANMNMGGNNGGFNPNNNPQP